MIEDPKLEQLRSLTREYSRYSRNAAGLGNVIGGALALVSYLAGIVLPLGIALRAALVATPLLWILAKELLRRRYYQRFGRVTEPIDPTLWRWHVFRTGFVALVSVGILLVLGYVATTTARTLPTAPIIGYALAVGLMPFLVWRYMWTVEEFLVGVFLTCQAAVAAAGMTYGIQAAWAPIAGIAALAVGTAQHRRFLQIKRQLDSRGAA